MSRETYVVTAKVRLWIEAERDTEAVALGHAALKRLALADGVSGAAGDIEGVCPLELSKHDEPRRRGRRW